MTLGKEAIEKTVDKVIEESGNEAGISSTGDMADKTAGDAGDIPSTDDASTSNPEDKAGDGQDPKPRIAGAEELDHIRELLPDDAWHGIVDKARSAILAKEPAKGADAGTKMPIPKGYDEKALAEYRRRHPDLPASENKAPAIRRTDEFWEIVTSLGGRDMRPKPDVGTQSEWKRLGEDLATADDLVQILSFGDRATRLFRRIRMGTVRSKVIDAIIHAGYSAAFDDAKVDEMASRLAKRCREFLSTGDVARCAMRLMEDYGYDDYDDYDDYDAEYDLIPGHGDGRHGRGHRSSQASGPTSAREMEEMLEWAVYEAGLIGQGILGIRPWDNGKGLDEHAKAIRKTYLESDIGKATKELAEAWGEQDLATRASTLSAARARRDRVISAVDRGFGWDEIVTLVSENPRYKAMFDAERHMEQGILDRIPEDPIDLYPIARSMERRFVLHIGPTNSGKTHDAIEALGKAPSGAYLAPLRLLAYEQYERLNSQGCPCSLLTGEEDVKEPGARHVASTIEMLDLSSPIDVAVIDEAQMLSDPDRGCHWTAAILGVPAAEVHVCLAPEAERIVTRLIRACGEHHEVVRHERMTPLEHEDGAFRFPKDVKKGDALVVFSRRAVHAVAAVVAESGLTAAMVYGALPYDVRHREAERFAAGEADVVVATDAIGMGMNLPIRRVVLLEQTKFDGKEQRLLNAGEVRQIAGRAGRYGLHEKGLWKAANATRQMMRLFDADIPQIGEAPLGFEKSLLGVDGAVSQLMAKWAAMPVDRPFAKQGLEREQALAAELEQMAGAQRSMDPGTKRLVLAFATLPFKEQVAGLRGTWRQMFIEELEGRTYEVKVPTGDLPKGMDALEAQYAHLDLLHQYCRAFGHPEHYAEIAERRDAISGRISEIISKSVFEARRCRECGRTLPWNWPYPMCDPCHDRLYPRRWGGYGEWW